MLTTKRISFQCRRELPINMTKKKQQHTCWVNQQWILLFVFYYGRIWKTFSHQIRDFTLRMNNYICNSILTRLTSLVNGIEKSAISFSIDLKSWNCWWKWFCKLQITLLYSYMDSSSNLSIDCKVLMWARLQLARCSNHKVRLHLKDLTIPQSYQ